MNRENVKGTESPVLPGADDAAASCVIFTASIVWKPHVTPGFIQTNTYWALTLLSVLWEAVEKLIQLQKHGFRQVSVRGKMKTCFPPENWK